MCRLQVCLRDRTVLELWSMNMNAAEPEPRKCCKSVGLPGQKWANVETPTGYTLRGFTEHPSTAVKKANNAAVLAARQVGRCGPMRSNVVLLGVRCGVRCGPVCALTLTLDRQPSTLTLTLTLNSQPSALSLHPQPSSTPTRIVRWVFGTRLRIGDYREACTGRRYGLCAFHGVGAAVCECACAHPRACACVCVS